jgi:hypothetical protein
MQNFVNAILKGEALFAHGKDGLQSVELANAILFSALQNQTLAMPMDAAAWENKLNQLIKESTFKKEVREVSSDDFVQSFNR